MGIAIRQDAPNQLGSMIISSQEAPSSKALGSAEAPSPTNPTRSKASSGFSFGDMTCTNIASALGVEQTQHTMGYQTKMVQEDSTLQQKLASMLGGAGDSNSNGGGLYGMELTMQVSSANSAAEALESSGEGLINAGIVSAGSTALCLTGVAGSVANFKPDSEMTAELDNAKEFQTNLNKVEGEDSPAIEDNEIAEENTINASQTNSTETTSTEEEDKEIDNMIKTWKGSPDRDYDISGYKKDASPEQAKIQEKALAKLKKNEADRNIVKNHIEAKISNLKSKISQKQSERLNTVTQIVGQAGNSATNLAQGLGQEAQSQATGVSQTESAESQYFEKMVQSYDQQMRNLQQMAGSFSAAADSTAQQMAFQG